MKSLLILGLIAVGATGLKWNDFRGGDIALPTKQKDAEAGGWSVVEVDDTLGVTWMIKESDEFFAVGFDNNGNCAGVYVKFLQSGIADDYLTIYQDFLDECEINGEKAFKYTTLFTDERILKSGGRDMLADDEVALGIYLKQGSSYQQLARDGCRQIKKSFYEQSCQSGYGLILTSFNSDSDSKSFSPSYTMYDPEDSGNLIGFGLILYSKSTEGGSFRKVLSAETTQAMFSNAPSCLTSYNGLTVVEVWLSYTDSLQTTCSGDNWTQTHCQHKISERGDSDSSDSSDSSNSSGEKSFWSKLFDWKFASK